MNYINNIKTKPTQMKLTQALQILHKAGYTFIKKERCEFTDTMEYYFTKGDRNYCWNITRVRHNARTQDMKLWFAQQEAKYAFGVQDELFNTDNYLAA